MVTLLLLFYSLGISFKTQGLYFIVFITRYLDLYKVILHPSKLHSGLILYNSIMKVLYIALTLYICNMMMRVSPYRTTYDKNSDTYRVTQWAILPAAVLAIIFHRHTDNLFLDVIYSILYSLVNMDFFHLFGGRLHYAPDYYAPTLQGD